MFLIQIILLISYILPCLPPEATISSMYAPQCALLYLPRDAVLNDFFLSDLGITYDDVKEYQLLEVMGSEEVVNWYTINAKEQSCIIEQLSDKRSYACMKVALSYFFERVSRYTLGNATQPRSEDIHELGTIGEYLGGVYEHLQSMPLAEDLYLIFVYTVSNLLSNAIGVQFANKQNMPREHMDLFDSLLGYCKELNASIVEEQKKRSVTFHYYFWKGNLQLWESSSMRKRQNRYFAASYFREAAKYADESRNRILLQKKAAKLLGSI